MKKSTKIYLASFFIPFFSFFIVNAILKIYPFGDNLFLFSDMKFQYISFIAYLKSIIFGSNDLNYTFAAPLGSNFVGLFGYYLTSPFNLLTLIIPNKVLPMFIPLLIALKIGTSGLTLTYYLKTQKEKFSYDSLIFSISYSLSSFIICYCYHIMWIDVYCLLPLFIVGLDKIINNESPKFYIIVLLISIIVNYYITFMICIFSIIYIIYRLLTEEISWKERIIVFKKYIISSILSVLISCVILLPIVLSLSEGKSDFVLNIDMFLTVKSYDTILTGLFSSTYVWDMQLPNIFVGIFVPFLVVLYFFNKKFTFKNKVITAGFIFVLLSLFTIPGFNVVMHGFDYPNSFSNRFSFIFIFVLIMLAYKTFKNITGLSKRDIMIACIVTLFSTYFIFDSFNIYIKLEMILLIVYSFLIFLLIVKGKNIRRFIIIILILLNLLNMIINVRYNLREINNQGFSNIKDNYTNKYTSSEKAINTIKNKDRGLYRIEKTPSLMYNYNDAMMFNYKSITNFSSTNKIETLDFLNKLGFQKYIVTSTYYDGSTKAVDSLLGIKYVWSDYENYKGYKMLKKYDDSNIYINKNALDFGYVVSNDVKEFKGDYNNTFDYQNTLLKNLSGYDFGNVYSKLNFEAITKNLKLDQKDINTPSGKIINTKIYEKVNNNENATLTLKVDNNSKDLVYYFFDSYFDQTAKVYINGKELSKRELNNALTLGMFYLENSNKQKEIEIKFELFETSDSIKFNDMYFYKENEDILNKYLNKIKDKSTISLEEKSSSKLTGKVTLQEDGYLMFSIPYDEGWSLCVDGKKVEVNKLIDGLIGTQLTKGSHDIVLKYMPPGRRIGMLLSIIGLILTVFYIKKRC